MTTLVDMTDAQLIKDELRRFAPVASRTAVDFDDLAQAARIALWRCPSPHGGYRRLTIRKALRDELRRETGWLRLAKRPKIEWSEMTPGIERRAAVEAGTPRDPFLWGVVRRSTRPKRYEALRLHYGQDMTLEEIGRRMGTSRQAAWHLVSRGLQDARKALGAAS